MNRHSASPALGTEEKSILNDLISAVTSYLKKEKNLENFRDDYHAFPLEAFAPFANFHENLYARNVLHRDKNFELILVGWNLKQETGFHDHAENGCLFKILQGEVLEERILSDKSRVSRSLYAGDLGYIHNNYGTHNLKNPSSTQTAVSFHLYSPPGYIAKALKSVSCSFSGNPVDTEKV